MGRARDGGWGVVKYVPEIEDWNKRSRRFLGRQKRSGAEERFALREGQRGAVSARISEKIAGRTTSGDPRSPSSFSPRSVRTSRAEETNANGTSSRRDI